MKSFAQTVAFLAYVAVAILQWIAEVDGLREAFDWSSFVSWVIAFFTAWIPIVGSAFGVWGAHAAWEWDWLPSIALFFGIPILGIVFVAVATAIDSFRIRKLRP